MFNHTLGLADVQRILCVFPPGCAGLVGMSWHLGGSPVYPNVGNQFYAFDDYTYVLDVTNQVTTGQWAVAAYNYDYLDHNLQLVYEYNIVNAGTDSSIGSSLVSL